MDPMSEYLARATIDARLVLAQERRQGRQIEDERRAERRRERRLAIARWWQSRLSRGPDVGARGLAAAAATPVRPPSVELAQVLEEAAHHLAEQGTSAERRLLEAMSEVAAQSAPGAAAALVRPGRHRGIPSARVRSRAHARPGRARSERARVAPRPP